MTAAGATAKCKIAFSARGNSPRPHSSWPRRIDLTAIPAVGAENKAKATGDLTIHGVTKRVTIDVTYQLVSATEIRILGTVPIVWADYQIPSPTFAGVADVRDNGAMEFLIVATR